MLELNGPDFMYAVMEIQRVDTIINERPEGDGYNDPLDPNSQRLVEEQLNVLEQSVTVLHAALTSMAIKRIRAEVASGKMTWKRLGESMIDLRSRLQDELSLVRLFVLDPRLASYLSIGGDLVGAAINNHYPKAIFELEEAAKCLAVMRPTASAFHSMRALEVAIRALARFLSISDPMKPTDRNWGNVLKTIKDGIQKKYLNPIELAPNTEGSIVQDLYAHLDAIKNPWRNATMHAESIYQPEESDHILKCVLMFFRKCAELFDEDGNPT